MAKKKPKLATRVVDSSESKLRRNEIEVADWRYAFSPIDEYGNPMKMVYMEASPKTKKWMKGVSNVIFCLDKRDMRRLQQFLTRLLDEKRTPTLKKKVKGYDFWDS